MTLSREDLVEYVTSVAQAKCEEDCLSDFESFLESQSSERVFIYKSNGFARVSGDYKNLAEAKDVDLITVLLKPHGSENALNKLVKVTIPIDRTGSRNEVVEILRQTVDQGLASLFSMAVADDDSSTIKKARNKFQELSISLQNLQQRIKPPDFLELVHPVIRIIVKMEDQERNQWFKTNEMLLADPKFLNEITNIVNIWTVKVLQFVLTDHEPADGMSVKDEIIFWNSFYRALLSLQEQLLRPEVLCTLEILNRAKRFQATLAFKNVGLEDCIAKAQTYNSLLEGLPIDDLFFETDLRIDKFEKVVSEIFYHFKKLKNIPQYPLSRALKIVDAIIVDLVHMLSRMFLGLHLMSIPIDEFDILYKSVILKAYNIIDNNVKFITTLFREYLRKRQEKFFVIKVDQDKLGELKKRTQLSLDIRHKHNNLLGLLSTFLGDIKAANELMTSYNDFIVLADFFALSANQKSIFSFNIRLYFEKFAKLEKLIVARINDHLSYCEKFNDYISLYNDISLTHALFDRVMPLISDEYKLRILTSGSEEIERIINLGSHQEKKIISFISSIDSTTMETSSITSKVSWRVNLIKRLQWYCAKLKEIVGNEWNKYTVGSEIEVRINKWTDSLDPERLFQDWIKNVENIDINLEARVFKVQEREEMELIINFDYSLLGISTEIDCLQNMGFRVPLKLCIKFKDIKKLTKVVMMFDEKLKTFRELIIYMNKSKYGLKFAFLFESQIEVITEYLISISQSNWAELSNALMLTDPHTEKINALHEIPECEVLYQTSLFPKSVDKLHRGFNELQRLYQVVYNEVLPSLIKRKFEYDQMRNELSIIQTEVLKLSFIFKEENYLLCKIINKDILEVLSKCCLRCIRKFVESFDDHSNSENNEAEERDDILQHTIILDEGVIDISPSLTQSKIALYNRANGIVNLIERLEPIRLENGAQTRFEYSNMESLRISLEIDKAYATIDDCIQTCSSYFYRWTVLEEMWNVDLSSEEEVAGIFNGEDINAWSKYFKEMLSLKAVFSTDSASVLIKNWIRIDFSKVQNRIISKFDSFQKDFMNKFSVKLKEHIAQLREEILTSRSKVDARFLSGTAFKDLILRIDDLIRLLPRIDTWKLKIRKLRDIQSLLRKQRFKFLSDWVFVEQLENDLSMLSNMKLERVKDIEDLHDHLSSKLKLEADILQDRVGGLSKTWEREKPKSGDMVPSEVLERLDKVESDFLALKSMSEVVSRVSNFISVDVQKFSIPDACIEDIKSMKEVWCTIYTVSNRMESVKCTVWTEIDIDEVHHELQAILNESKSYSATIRQYEAFISCQSVIRDYIAHLPLLRELKLAGLKHRHWNMIFSHFRGAELSLNSLTLYDLITLHMVGDEKFIRWIVLQAKNENSIEDGLKSMELRWNSSRFETFEFDSQNRKILLVRNWGVLLDQCTNDMNELGAMRASPYLSVYEQNLSSLESQLNDLFNLFEISADVQRQWMYLDGVFGSQNGEIKNILPTEFSRFNNLTYAYLGTLKKMCNVKSIMEALAVSNIFDVMNKVSSNFSELKTALNSYLERQRELYPRFYFVGNDDLLEIIGNSSDPKILNKHLNKLFTGITFLEFADEGCSIIGVKNATEERIVIDHPVELTNLPRLHQWLQELENQVKSTLANLTLKALRVYSSFSTKADNQSAFSKWITLFPEQVCFLVCNITFTRSMESVLQAAQFATFLEHYEKMIVMLSQFLSDELSLLMRRKVENLLVEFIHQRDIIISLMKATSVEERTSIWDIQQLYYFDESEEDVMESVTVKQAGYCCKYGFEYQGAIDKLVYTPLVNKCFLSMTQALDLKYGGSPFGPAGTGKTETIKALGYNLGKMVLTFCCDESFDFGSISRILLGICKIGCFACFDEFNRLDEQNLSAVSSQIESIEYSLRDGSNSAQISNKLVKINPSMGIFVTMNPGYIGRSELPENLKKLFRSFSMKKPDLYIIVEVLMKTQGFRLGKELSVAIVDVFRLFEECLSDQSHYDFGLRAVKSVVRRCGNMRRHDNVDNSIANEEKSYVFRSIDETIAPRLVKQDESLYRELLSKKFSQLQFNDNDEQNIFVELEKLAKLRGLQFTNSWFKKCLQLYHIQRAYHGIMLVGSAASGKSTILQTVADLVASVELKEPLLMHIDCKVLSKDQIFGNLDPFTKEWKDGVFSRILRNINNNIRHEAGKRIWIIFDGDIDPEWAENLNSVLDDNKMLTLPNGERIFLPSNVKLIFEVSNLKYTSPATVSRCGMVWFDKSLLTAKGFLERVYSDISKFVSHLSGIHEDLSTTAKEILETIWLTFAEMDVEKLIEDSEGKEHIMKFTTSRALEGFRIFLQSNLRQYFHYCINNRDLILDSVKEYALKSIYISLVWAFVGDCKVVDRQNFLRSILRHSCFEAVIDQDYDGSDITNCYIALPSCKWSSWSSRVPIVDLEPFQVTNPGLVIPTIDTSRNENLIYSIVNEHHPLLLCGPPGSGKTMTLLETLKKSPHLEVLSLNFSKETSPQSLLKSLAHHCVHEKGSNGLYLTPKAREKWLVVFCDEINLPSLDKYGNQKVISLLRQMIEYNGFWDPVSRFWVSLTNIQFVGACNPPDDPGRVRLNDRFLHHFVILNFDYPQKESLLQIYSTLNAAVVRCIPRFKDYALTMTEAMIEVYTQSKDFLSSIPHPHYVYSPRELTRWSKGMLQVLLASELSSFEDIIRLWYYEGQRLFYDRLVSDNEKEWTKALFKTVISQKFPEVEVANIIEENYYITNLMSLTYEVVGRNELKSFISEKLKIFGEEEMEEELVLYDDFLDFSLRVDRALKQPMGHIILVGSCTSGKNTLVKLVSWMNGIRMEHLALTECFSIKEFDEGLRQILLKCINDEQICFLIDDVAVLGASFIERMNNLLANAEIPGLFEGEDYMNLIKCCTDRAAYLGSQLKSDDEAMEWFRQQICEKLHVVFCVNELDNKNGLLILSSPALFNRCVISWMGDWSDSTIETMCHSFLDVTPIDITNYNLPMLYKSRTGKDLLSMRDVVIDVLLRVHRDIAYKDFQNTPGRLISVVKEFMRLFNEKLEGLEKNHRRVTYSLDKMKETVIRVNDLKRTLSIKQEVLQRKDKEAKIMLDKMLFEQNEAERKREFSVSTQKELAKQDAEIFKRRNEVQKDLEFAEPAVFEAQRGVQNIKKQHLTEIRSMSNPPAAVKMTMESVCALIGFPVSNWKDVQHIIRRDDFIPSIVLFDAEVQLTEEVKHFMIKNYLSRDGYNFETVNRASKACGPLLQWVNAQINFSDVLESVGPLREELSILEKESKKMQALLIAIDQMIEELEESIEKYKDDYTNLIRDAENIKMEMRTVEGKVDRSLALIESLSSERKRWETSIGRFNIQRESLVGNCILSSLFLVYGGSMDPKERHDFLQKCKVLLEDASINFDDELSIPSYLLGNEEILELQMSGFLSDELFLENLAILNASRFPLVVDPSGKALESLLILSTFKSVRMSSFLEKDFVKKVLNMVRFGGLILIKDAEFYNPVLNSLIRNELNIKGGRTLIRIGKDEVDVSPHFRLVLYSRAQKIRIPETISARVTVISFTVTKGTLQNVILDSTLRQTNPDMAERRDQILKLQGEYQARLMNLEDQLLSSLNDTEGNILDNNDILVTLETIKKESIVIDEKMLKSRGVMKEVNESRKLYEKIAIHSSAIFEVLEKLPTLNPLYFFPIEAFLTVFYEVLNNCNTSDVGKMIVDLYKETYARISVSITHNDGLVVGIILAVQYYAIIIGPLSRKVILYLLDALKEQGKRDLGQFLDRFDYSLDASGALNFTDLLKRNNYDELMRVCEELITFTFFNEHSCSIEQALIGFVSILFDKSSHSKDKYSLESFATNKTQAAGTTILATNDNYDASFRVEELARGLDIELLTTSMGSREGTDEAERNFTISGKKKTWVLIQNIQMSPIWLKGLSLLLEDLKLYEGSKIFLGCNLNSSLPLPLLSKTQLLVIEEQLSFKEQLKELLGSLGQNTWENCSGVFRHALFLLSWLHAILLERMNFAPASFLKKYDINNSDFKCSVALLDKVMTSINGKFKPVAVNNIPWKFILYMIGTIVYGGKIDDEDDLAYSQGLSDQYLRPSAFETNFNLVNNPTARMLNMLLSIPEDMTSSSYFLWIQNLPESVPVEWLGLEAKDVDILKSQRDGNIIEKLIQMLS